jgi:hypothetical protein
MKKVTIESTWFTAITVEVEDDVEINDDNFQDWPQEVLEQVTSQTADLVDWKVK